MNKTQLRRCSVSVNDNKSRNGYLVIDDVVIDNDLLTWFEKIILSRIMGFEKDGYFESAQATAEFLHMNLSTVKEARAKFVKLGFIEKVGMKNGRTHYSINEDTITKYCQGGKTDKKKSFLATQEVGITDSRSRNNRLSQNDTYIYNNKEDNKDITPLTPLRGAVAVQKIKNNENDEVDNIFNLWLSCFGLSGRKLTSGRRVKIKRRLKDCGKEQLELAIRNASQDYFYRGDNDRGWQADIDYICRSAEIVERLANMTPRGERPMTWWEEKQQRELEQCAPRYGGSERGYVVAEGDDPLALYVPDPEPTPKPKQADEPASEEAPLDMDALRKRFLEGKARAKARNEASRSSDKARAKVGL